MNNNLEKNFESSHVPPFKPMDSGAYATEHLKKIAELNNKIAAKQAELTEAAEQSASNPIASAQSYAKLFSIIKKEIAQLEQERDTLHLQKTVH